MTVQATADELKQWLEWSGQTLLSLSIKSPMPKAYGNNWPEPMPDFNTAYGYTNERLRPGQPTSHEIDLMDAILSLTALEPDLTRRRLLHCRALVTPVSNRYVYSWTRLAFMLHTNRQQVAIWHKRSLETVAGRVPVPKIHAIRPSFASAHATPLTP